MRPVDYNSLTQAQRRTVRERYIKAQDGKCYHCGGFLAEEPTYKPDINWDLFPPSFLRWPVHLHHNHNDGMTIGAVHSYCNAILWQYHGE